MSKSQFTEDELRVMQEIFKQLNQDQKATVKVKDFAQSFFMNNAVNRHSDVDFTTEAWVNAVVQYLLASGYEIKKR